MLYIDESKLGHTGDQNCQEYDEDQPRNCPRIKGLISGLAALL